MSNKTLTPEDFVHFQGEVEKWNAIANNFPSNKDLIDTYISLCQEECKEMVYAPNSVELLDSIIDQMFTGFFLQSLTEGSFRNDLVWLERVCNRKTPLTKTSYESVHQEILDGNSWEYITDLVNVIVEHQHMFDIRGAFENVLASNMSKFCKKGSVDTEKEIEYITAQGRYGDVSVHEVITADGEEYIVFYAGKDLQEGKTFEGRGKIVKTSGFFSPSLEKYVL